MKKILFYLSTVLVIIFLLISSDRVIAYTKSSMELCYELIIPTLFPFFVCSGLLIYSGFGSVLARAAQGFMRPLFNVAPAGAAAFVLGIISGFPLGAVTAVQLYNCGALSKAEAERLLAFCNNSGPLFIVGSIGAAIYSRPLYGVIIYAAHITASVLVGICLKRCKRNKHNSPPMRLDTEDMPLPAVFGKAVSDGAKNIVTVCFSIIFFSAVSRALLDCLPLSESIYAVVSGLFEFSTGTLNLSLADYGLYEKLVLTAFIVSFSGICVHVQVMSVTAGSGLDLKLYFLGKLLHGIFAAAITAAALRFIPLSAPVFSPCSAALSASCCIIPVFFIIAALLVLALRLLCRKKNRRQMIS